MGLLGLAGKLLVSLLLWPMALGMALALGATLAAPAWPWQDPRVLCFFGGILAYVLVQVFFWKPIFVYVLGHELTHALASFLQGGEADHLHASTQGGKVKVTRNNFLVSLAPYFFPLYTFLFLLAYWISAERFQLPIIFLLGASLAFHLVLTAYSMREHQSDITEVGWIFAIPFILALNLLIFLFVLKQVAPETVSLLGYGRLSLDFVVKAALWLRSLF